MTLEKRRREIVAALRERAKTREFSQRIERCKKENVANAATCVT
jgi:hypothetical protein